MGCPKKAASDSSEQSHSPKLEHRPRNVEALILRIGLGEIYTIRIIRNSKMISEITKAFISGGFGLHVAPSLHLEIRKSPSEPAANIPSRNSQRVLCAYIVECRVCI